MLLHASVCSNAQCSPRDRTTVTISVMRATLDTDANLNPTRRIVNTRRLHPLAIDKVMVPAVPSCGFTVLDVDHCG